MHACVWVCVCERERLLSVKLRAATVPRSHNLSHKHNFSTTIIMKLSGACAFSALKNAIGKIYFLSWLMQLVINGCEAKVRKQPGESRMDERKICEKMKNWYYKGKHNYAAFINTVLYEFRQLCMYILHRRQSHNALFLVQYRNMNQRYSNMSFKKNYNLDCH